MKVADPEEYVFLEAKQKVEKILRQQYQDWARIYDIFIQLNPIVTNHLSLKINKFLRQEIKSKLDYFKLVSEIKWFKKLWFDIPHHVNFPLFTINWEEVKNKLLERTEGYLNLVFKDIENDIIQKSIQIDKRHNEIWNYLAKVLTTAEEVQMMDKYTNNLILERSIMQDRIDEWRNTLFLLINMDYNISEQTQSLAQLVYVSMLYHFI